MFTLKAKARQFYSLYSEQLTNLSKTDQFEVPNCQVWSKLSGLKISDNIGFKPGNYLWGFEAGRSIIHQILNSSAGFDRLAGTSCPSGLTPSPQFCSANVPSLGHFLFLYGFLQDSALHGLQGQIGEEVWLQGYFPDPDIGSEKAWRRNHDFLSHRKTSTDGTAFIQCW